MTAGAIKDNHQEIPGIHIIKKKIYIMVGGFKHFIFFHDIWDNPSH